MTRQPLTNPESLDDALRTIATLNRQNEAISSELAVLRSELKQLRQEKEQFEIEHERVGVFLSAIDQCSESIFFTDLEGRILYANRSFQQTSGYALKELIGRTPRILKSGVHPPEFYGEMWDTILAGRVWRSRVTNRRKDGGLYHEEASVAPVRDDQGAIICFVSVKTDISYLLEHKQALEEANAELTESNAELEQFAYVASHDLQEPLRAVTSCMQLLKKRTDGALDKRSGEFIDHSVSACLRMHELIEGLLTISRVNSTTRRLEPTDVGSALEEARSNLTASIDSSGAVIDCEPMPTVLGNNQMLTCLFQNLIGNAIKFSSGKATEIRIATKQNGESWLFSIQDNGIAEEYLTRIFQIFQRLHTRDEYPGTGIGLAICQKIVVQHGGRIWVESESGHGSTFFFTLPAIPDLPAKETNQATPHPPNP